MHKRYLLKVLILGLTYSIILFLVMQGSLRLWEINSKSYKEIEKWCEPKGIFGWGYNCDNVAYNNQKQNNFIFQLGENNSSLFISSTIS